jgi:hypothetical protein
MNKKAVGRKMDQFRINRIIAFTILFIGLFAATVSAFFASLVLATIGLGLTFWGALLLYIAPSRHVSLDILNAAAISNLTNIEKVITESKTNGKGVYLPPKYLKDFESSLVFIPATPEQPLPTPEEVDEEKLHSKNPHGVFLTPPGLGLSKLFEKQLGTSFTRTDLNYVQKNLAKLLIEDTEIAEDADMKIENSTITIEITNHIFKTLCEETRKLQRTHEALGCPLSSAIACALAKATGKPITIEKEEQTQDGKTTKIQYLMIERGPAFPLAINSPAAFAITAFRKT